MSRPSYDHIDASLVPAGVRFDVADGFLDKVVQIAFGGEPGEPRHEEGALYKRVQNTATGALTFFRRAAQSSESERPAWRAFEGTKAFQASNAAGARERRPGKPRRKR